MNRLLNHRRNGSNGDVSEENWNDFHSKHHSNAYHYSADNEKYVRQQNARLYPSSPRSLEQHHKQHSNNNGILSSMVHSMTLHDPQMEYTPRSTKTKLAMSSRHHHASGGSRRSRTVSPSRKYRA